MISPPQARENFETGCLLFLLTKGWGWGVWPMLTICLLRGSEIEILCLRNMCTVPNVYGGGTLLPV